MTPTQELILEVLAARHRLGEPFWPFSRRLRRHLDILQAAGLISYESDVMPDAYRVRLTEAGRREALSDTYVSPDARRTDDLLGLVRELLPIVQYVSQGRGYIGVVSYPDAQARRTLGLARDTLGSAAFIAEPSAPTGDFPNPAHGRVSAGLP